MSISKKHFEQLADELSRVKPNYEDDVADCALDQWKRDCRAVATMCAYNNSNFDTDRFLRACGMWETEP